MDPPSLGPRFGELLTAAKEGNLEGVGLAVHDVCEYWDGFLQKVADRLRAELHVDVSAAMTSAERQDNELRLRNLQTVAVGEGRLTGTLKVKNAASDITIDVLLSARAVRFGIEVKAPSEGRQLTRLKWMTRQLAKAPPEALLHVQFRSPISRFQVSAVNTTPDRLTRGGEAFAACARPARHQSPKTCSQVRPSAGCKSMVS